MHIAVLGAGVTGLTTASALAERGHDVTIIDRQAHEGAETSAANGAQLSYSFVAPLASPDTLRQLPGLLLSPTSPMRIALGLDTELIDWGLRFLASANTATMTQTVTAQLALAALSRAEMERLTRDHALSFGLRQSGKLILYRQTKAFEKTRAALATNTTDNGQQALDAAACLAHEPALRLRTSDLAGGVWSPAEQVGDCAAFCREIGARLARRNNVRRLMSTRIEGPRLVGGRLAAISTAAGRIEADAFVLCLGASSPAFARACGVTLPIYPLKGYSLTAPQRPGARPLQVSVTDLSARIVLAPLRIEGRDVVRIAGIADLVGHDTRVDPRRLALLRSAATDLIDLDLDGDIAPWAGLRPATPDSRPIIGWSKVKGLFFNTGHGMLGWTLAAGSARLTADLIEEKQAAVEAGPFAWPRAN